MKAYLLLAGLALVSGAPFQRSPANTQAPFRDVIPIDRSPTPQDGSEPRRKTVKIVVRYARAADISEALGGSILDFGKNRVEETPSRWGWSGGAANLLPAGIDSLVALTSDNTLITRYSDEDSLRELVDIVRGLDIRPRSMEVVAECEMVYTDRAGKQTRSTLTARGSTTGERRLHLRSKREEAGPLAAQTSDADIYARFLEDGSISLGADWYVDVTVAAGGKGGRSSVKNIYRTDAVAASGKTVTAAKGTLTVGDGKLDLTLRLTPRISDPGADHAGRPLSRVSK